MRKSDSRSRRCHIILASFPGSCLGTEPENEASHISYGNTKFGSQICTRSGLWCGNETICASWVKGRISTCDVDHVGRKEGQREMEPGPEEYLLEQRWVEWIRSTWIQEMVGKPERVHPVCVQLCFPNHIAWGWTNFQLCWTHSWKFLYCLLKVKGGISCSHGCSVIFTLFLILESFTSNLSILSHQTQKLSYWLVVHKGLKSSRVWDSFSLAMLYSWRSRLVSVRQSAKKIQTALSVRWHSSNIYVHAFNL